MDGVKKFPPSAGMEFPPSAGMEQPVVGSGANWEEERGGATGRLVALLLSTHGTRKKAAH